MATQGPYYAGTVVEVDAGGLPWAGVTYAAQSDDVRATVSLTAANPGSDGLKATNFGFSIPAGATIDGITVEIERRSNGANTAIDGIVKIVKNDVILNPNRASATPWPGTDTFASYGGATDLWSQTWTVSDINSSTFGVALSANRNAADGSAEVDSMRITVNFTAPVVITRSVAPSLLGV